MAEFDGPCRPIENIPNSTADKLLTLLPWPLLTPSNNKVDNDSTIVAIQRTPKKNVSARESARRSSSLTWKKQAKIMLVEHCCNCSYTSTCKTIVCCYPQAQKPCSSCNQNQCFNTALMSRTTATTDATTFEKRRKLANAIMSWPKRDIGMSGHQ